MDVYSQQKVPNLTWLQFKIQKTCHPDRWPTTSKLPGHDELHAVFSAPLYTIQCHPCIFWRKNIHLGWGSLPSLPAAQSSYDHMTTKPLQYYDHSKTISIHADPSRRGLCVCLPQEGHPIAFISKPLNDTQTHNVDIERELLAVMFTCMMFHTHLFVRSFTVKIGHKPLEMITMKTPISAPPRLKQGLLHLLSYDLVIKYKPEKETLLAKTLFCLPSWEQQMDILLDTG